MWSIEDGPAPCPSFGMRKIWSSDTIYTNREGVNVSIFPTKILLATDSSEEATLAAKTAADIAQKTGSELHIVHASPVPVYIDPATDRVSDIRGAEETVKGGGSTALRYPGGTDQSRRWYCGGGPRQVR
jgi:hypothetical protein